MNSEKMMSPGNGSGPDVSELFTEQYPRLLSYVEQQIEHHVALEDLPPASIDAEAVVDEVARVALGDPAARPGNLTPQLWFYALARQDLRQRQNALFERSKRMVSLDGGGQTPAMQAAEEELPTHQEQPIDFGIPDDHTPSPDQVAEGSDLVALIRRRIRSWPELDRDVFELHFLEGFEDGEIAMIRHMEPAAIGDVTERVQERLRRMLLDERRLALG